MIERLFLILFAIFAISFTLLLFSVAVFITIREIKRGLKLTKANVLLWRHADKTPDGEDCLQLLHIPPEGEFIRSYFKQTRWPSKVEQYLPVSKHRWQIWRRQREDKTELLKTREKNAHACYKELNIIPGRCPTYRYREVWWQWFDTKVKWLYEQKIIDTQTKGSTYSIVPFNPDDFFEIGEMTSSELGENIDWECSKGVFHASGQLLEKVAVGSSVLMAIITIGAIFMTIPFLVGG